MFHRENLVRTPTGRMKPDFLVANLWQQTDKSEGEGRETAEREDNRRDETAMLLRKTELNGVSLNTNVYVLLLHST
jgi:hypothetical protein